MNDGSLIDLCGATLLWRSVEGLKKTPVDIPDLKNLPQILNSIYFQTRRLLELELDQLNSKKPQCPVGLNTLIIKTHPLSSTTSSSSSPNAFVYVSCGHVHGNHKWGVRNDNKESRECPLCRTIGPLIPIIPGIESAFYVIPDTDNESTTSYAFQPCGHMTSQSTALYWSKIKVPYGKTINCESLFVVFTDCFAFF